MSKSELQVVLFTVAGLSLPALVLSSREGEVSHLGKGGEPLLTLAVVKQPSPNAQPKRPQLLQADLATPEIEIVRDVVHASHEFSSQFKADKGIITQGHVASHRGQGEWSEWTDDSDFQEAFEKLSADRKQAWANAHEAEKEALNQKARADKAEKELAEIKADVPPASGDVATS